MLILTDQLTAGNEAPKKKFCSDPWIETMSELCRIETVNLDVSEGKIIHAFVTTRKTQLTIGDVMRTWGEPTGANYFKYSISIYWPDRHAYVLRPFDPSSPVVFLFYSHELTLHDHWRGYLTSWGR